MVKIKDFTLASQNLGVGHLTPRAYTPGAHGDRRYYIYYSTILA